MNLNQYLAQLRNGEAYLRLNAREEECWRMFGVLVTYVHDERLIEYP